jgi:hypothetical protein
VFVVASQKENLAKYLLDISKGLVLAVAVGLASSTLSAIGAFLFSLMAVYGLWAGLVLIKESQ